MTSTERLYYNDCYVAEFTAQVVDRELGGSRIYLDRTAFYPTSGGQPNDLGTLNGRAVLDVIDEGERIAHLVEQPLAGDAVKAQLDWNRRYDHMQQHTGQHLLSAVMMERFGIPTVSFHMGSQVSTIELKTKELQDEQVAAAEDQVNEIARQNRTVRIGYEDAEAAGGLRKASERTGILRIIEIDGWDKSACGGTHVRSTAEICPLQIRRAEKVRGNVRVEFVCGRRAIAGTRSDFRLLMDLSRQAATAFDRLPEHFAGLRERLAEAEKNRQRLTLDLAQREGRELYSATEPGTDGVRRLILEVMAIDETARVKAQAFAGQGRAVALVVGTSPGGALIASSPDSGVNAGAILKAVLAATGGRGGGSATLAQGSLPNAGAASMLAAALGLGL